MRAVETALAEDTPAAAARRISLAQANSWDARYRTLSGWVAQLAAAEGRG